MTATEPLVETVWIDAPPDRVFPFFTDPSRLTQWLGDLADIDPVPGGRFAVEIGARSVRGEYVVLDPPHRLSFTWGDTSGTPLAPSSTRVDVELAAHADGTTVTLSHHGLTGATRADHGRGWPIKLAQLSDAASGRSGRG